MNSALMNPIIIHLIKSYWRWRYLWVGTTVMFGMIGMCYVVFLKKDYWVASQGMIVRAEANSAALKPGSFDNQSEMKAAQETILEIARNRQVVRSALEKVGPRASWFSGMRLLKPKWPSSSEVQSTATSAISINAPKGAPFGTTEVLYLAVKQDSPERAIALTNAMFDALARSLQDVRRSRAMGMIDELELAREVAQKKLGQVTDQIQIIERETGADLSDLRGMTDSNSGGSSSRLQLDALKAEIRQAEHQYQMLLTDLKLLQETLDKPMQLMVAPSSLVNSQPGLKRLREGLADSQLSLSSLQGRYSNSHPQVIAAMNARKEIEAKLQRELVLSVQSVQNDVEISQKRIEKLKSDQSLQVARLDKLAAIRAKYGNLVNELRTNSAILQDTERELARAQARSDAALSTSLITRLDAPVLGERPVGPGRTTILGSTVFLGLFFGLGIVFLLTPLDSGNKFGRRAQDVAVGTGRRQSDRDSRSRDPLRTISANFAQSSSESENNDRRSSAQPISPGRVILDASASQPQPNDVANSIPAAQARLQMRAARPPSQAIERRKKSREEPSKSFWSN